MSDPDSTGRVLRVIEESLELPSSSLPLTVETTLIGEGLGTDSIEILRLVAALEEEFDLEIDDERLTLGHFHSAGTVAEFVMSLIRQEKQ